MPSSSVGAERISVSGEREGDPNSWTVLEAEVSLTGNVWQKHPTVSGPEVLCISGIDCLRRGYFKDPEGYWWVFSTTALEAEEVKQLPALPGLSEDPSVVGLLKVREQVLVATTALLQQQHCTNWDTIIPIHKLIYQLESQAVISRTRPMASVKV